MGLIASLQVITPKAVDTVNAPPPPPNKKKEKVFMDSFSFAFQVNADSICANCGWRTIPNYSRKLHCSIQTLLIRNHAAHFYLHIPFGADLNQVSIHKTGGREIMFFH